MHIHRSLVALSFAIIALALMALACSGEQPDLNLDNTKQATVTPALAQIHFTSTWDEHLSGELRQGGRLEVSYDLQRLPECRGTHNGFPAWDTRATLRFSPSGTIVEGSVLAFQNDQGVPTNVAYKVPLVVEIPAGATSVELWFKNSTGAGSSCVAWDSNFNANYHYEIQPAADDPRCKQLWTKQNSDMPYATTPHCVEHHVGPQYNADHCELYVDGIGHGYMAHYGIPNRWLEAYLKVGPQHGDVRAVGMFSRARNQETGEIDPRVTFARQVSSDTWQTGLITLRSNVMRQEGFAYDIETLAFFVDVRRPNGELARLWQSRHGANYSMSDAFSLPTSMKSIPYGNIQYAHPDAAIFDAQRACR
ncbi:MAG: hypothetical protein JRH20_06995 [Deltaproteobacteria bacterium]|nr:hypothetical protein [Deltaproteobacteria bacterium]